MFDFKISTKDISVIEYIQKPELLKRDFFTDERSIRTRLRATLLICIGLIQPINRRGLNAIGYSKRIITGFLREAKIDEILIERAFHFYLTDKGKKTADEILKDSYIASWYQSIVDKKKLKYNIKIVGS